MSDETKIFTKNDKNGDKCASGGQESGLKLIFERGVAILVRPWRFPGQPKKFVFFSIKVGTINSGTSLDSREQFKKTGKLEFYYGGFTLLSPLEITRQFHEFREFVKEIVKNGLDQEEAGYAALVRDWPYWLPIFFFDNGDFFCIDMREKSFPVVFLEHDVMDGGPNLHGLRIASDLGKLLDLWSQVYFVECDWSLIVEDSGINPQRFFERKAN